LGFKFKIFADKNIKPYEFTTKKYRAKKLSKAFYEKIRGHFFLKY